VVAHPGNAQASLMLSQKNWRKNPCGNIPGTHQNFHTFRQEFQYANTNAAFLMIANHKTEV